MCDVRERGRVERERRACNPERVALSCESLSAQVVEQTASLGLSMLLCALSGLGLRFVVGRTISDVAARGPN